MLCVVCCVVCFALCLQDEATGVTQYRASSPDEEALVVAAKALGFDFKTPAPNVALNVSLVGRPVVESLQYNILCTNEFNSSRYVLYSPCARYALSCPRSPPPHPHSCVSVCGGGGSAVSPCTSTQHCTPR